MFSESDKCKIMSEIVEFKKIDDKNLRYVIELTSVVLHNKDKPVEYIYQKFVETLQEK